MKEIEEDEGIKRRGRRRKKKMYNSQGTHFGLMKVTIIGITTRITTTKQL